MLMHDHPSPYFNGLCADVVVCVLSESNEGWEVGVAAPLSSGSPALLGNILPYSLVWRPLGEEMGPPAI